MKFDHIKWIALVTIIIIGLEIVIYHIQNSSDNKFEYPK